MDILIFALVLILIVGLVIYLIDTLPMDARLSLIAKALIILVAIILLCNRAGLLWPRWNRSRSGHNFGLARSCHLVLSTAPKRNAGSCST